MATLNSEPKLYARFEGGAIYSAGRKWPISGDFAGLDQTLLTYIKGRVVAI